MIKFGESLGGNAINVACSEVEEGDSRCNIQVPVNPSDKTNRSFGFAVIKVLESIPNN